MEAPATRVAMPARTRVFTKLRSRTERRAATVAGFSLLLIGCGADRQVAHEADEGPTVAPEGGAHDPEGEDEDFTPPTVSFPGPDSHDALRLSQLGLYTDIAAKRLAPDLIAFEPRYALWSDGADKRRWLRLPAGTTIDNRDPDHWQLPVGSVLFKEFARAGKRLETRVIARLGPEANDTFMGTFLWQEDERDALLVRDGMANVRDTDHDLPTQANCAACHEGEPGRILGFSALQLAQPKAELFAVPLVVYELPGPPETRAALGYLHANCAHCHNPNGKARSQTSMNLRISVNDREPGQTTIERETVGVPLFSFTASDLSLRIVRGEPEQSGLLARMQRRGDDNAMPPLGTKHADDEGLALVRAWIAGIER
jgi:cytochrome c553